jgi:uncharacterized membrane protein YdfJ with MMPL/SSD domain
MFPALARVMIRGRIWVLVTYAALVPLAAVFGAHVISQLKAGGFEDPDRESWRVYALMQRELGAGAGDVIAVYETVSGTVESPKVELSILQAIDRLEQDPEVTGVASVYSTGAPHFVSRDRTKTFVIVDLRGDEQRKTEVYRRLLPAFDVDGLKVRFAGLIPTNIAVFETIRRDLTRAELIAFPLTALVCILVFESLAAVALLVVTGACAVVFAFAQLRAIVLVTDVSVFAMNAITVLGLGLAVDYSLFLVNRFREELFARGLDGDGTEDAVVAMMATTGRAVAFSGVTVAASLMGLFAFRQIFLRSLALGGVVVVIGTVVMTLTFVPAALAVLGPRIDAWRIRRPRPEQERAGDDNLWGRTARAVMKRPGLVALGLTAVLLCSALPFARFNGTLADYRVLPTGGDAAGVRETATILDTEFLPHQTTPHMVLVTTTEAARSRKSLEALAALSSRMSAIPGVSRVDGVFSFVPGVTTEQIIDELSTPRDNPLDEYALLRAYAKGSWMRFSVLSERSFDDPLSLQQVRALRAMSTPELKVEVAGYSAALLDLRAAIRDRGPWMVFAVTSVMFLVLFLLFGSVTLPLKAICMNALSLTASFGAIVWIFQDGRFSSLLGYTPLGVSDATQPLVTFATVFGLSMDYEVLILARVREEYLRTGDNSVAVVRALARTGRLITSAAALLVVVVGAFATSDVLFMKTLGVGMALAIAIDATVVRILLVPAMMGLLGAWNWYAPPLLARLWRRTGMSDDASTFIPSENRRAR